MSIHSVTPPHPIQPGDIVTRRKVSGFGLHFGTGLSDGNIAHTTPETGKTVVDALEFSAGLPILIRRLNRTPEENAAVEWRALSDIGQPYLAGVANCEHDMTMAQFGIRYSPTADNAKKLALVTGGLLCLMAITRRD